MSDFFIRAFISGSNRPGVGINPTTVTIHNTADPGATARNVAAYFGNHPEAKASCHWIVDGKEAVNIIPETEKAWHAGNRQGNMISIGVEVCEPGDGKGINSSEWPEIYRNAVVLTTDILLRHKWTTKNIKQHHDWTGKNCPRLLIPIWEQFLVDVQKELDKHLKPQPTPSRATQPDRIYRVQVGAYKNRTLAEIKLAELKAKGFIDAVIV